MQNEKPAQNEFKGMTAKEVKEYEKLMGTRRRTHGREYINAFIVGRRRRGKSTLMANMMQNLYLERQKLGIKRKILIVDLAPSLAFRPFPEFPTLDHLKAYMALEKGHPQRFDDGIARIKPPLKEMQPFVEFLTKYYRNGDIVWDEGNQWLETQGGLPDWQMPLFSANGNMGIDNYICLHLMSDIPRQLRTHTTHICYFATDDDVVSQKDLARLKFPGPHDKLFDTIQTVRNTEIDTMIDVKYHQWFEAQ